MADLKTLEARFDAAIGQITRKLDQAGTPGAELEMQVQRLRAENAALSADLDALRAQRAQDLAELDQLIDQLKPLIEEVA